MIVDTTPQQTYIICSKRKRGREYQINVEICENSCTKMDRCKEYKKYLASKIGDTSEPTAKEQASA